MVIEGHTDNSNWLKDQVKAITTSSQFLTKQKHKHITSHSENMKN